MTSSGADHHPPRPRVIAMLNQKGGVGKTTSAVNLGAALAQADRRVCLIDLDPQGHLTLHLGIDEDQIEHTVYDLLLETDCRAEDAVISEARPNLDAVLAEVDLAAAETELASQPDRQQILKRKFDAIADRYDVVIIDCPPSLGLLTLNALSMATEIFVPMQAHFLALQGVGRLLETVGMVCRSVNPGLRVSSIVLCMHEQQTTLAREIVADLDAFFEHARGQDVPWAGCRVLRPPIRRNIKLAEAPSFGKTIFDYAPWCPGALDYRKLARLLLDDWTRQAATSNGQPEAPAASTTSDEASREAEAVEKQRPDSEIESKPIDEPSTPERAHEPHDRGEPEETTDHQRTEPADANVQRGIDHGANA
jgi:chromosome partitioning protein